MDSRAIIDAVIVSAAGAVGLWRGYRRRRRYWRAASWIGFTATVIAGLAMMWFALYFSAAVDHHESWIGARGSNTRAAWIVMALGCMVGGVVLTAFSIVWFAQANPRRPFPFLDGITRRAFKSVAAEQPFLRRRG
jgi:hypothetical protein